MDIKKKHGFQAMCMDVYEIVLQDSIPFDYERLRPLALALLD